MPPHFLNVDLEIESTRTKLNVLIAELGEQVRVLHFGPTAKRNRHLLSLESFDGYNDPDATIHALCILIEGLSPSAREVWNGATRKEFDVGYEMQPSEHWSRFTLRSDTLERVAALGATLAITYYCRERTKPNHAPQRPPRTLNP